MTEFAVGSEIKFPTKLDGVPEPASAVATAAIRASEPVEGATSISTASGFTKPLSPLMLMPPPDEKSDVGRAALKTTSWPLLVAPSSGKLALIALAKVNARSVGSIG